MHFSTQLLYFFSKTQQRAVSTYTQFQNLRNMGVIAGFLGTPEA